jgi:hypothetical protein
MIMHYIERYPESLLMVDERGYLPLHILITDEDASIDTVVTAIEKCPAALEHPGLPWYRDTSCCISNAFNLSMQSCHRKVH